MRVWMGDAAGGEVVEEAAARVSVMDHGFLLGDSLFETVLTDKRGIQFWDRHCTRLLTSAANLGFAVPTEELLLAAAKSVIDPAASGFGRLRITLTSGEGPQGLARGDGSRLVLLWESFNQSTSALSLATSSVPRHTTGATVNLKTGSWLDNVLAMRHAKAEGADDALILNERGEVAETATANIFLVKNQTVLTPPLSSGCLAGVARQFLINNIPADIRFAELPLTVQELQAADEVFVTSALRGVASVGAVDGHVYEAEAPLTARLKSVFVHAAKESYV